MPRPRARLYVPLLGLVIVASLTALLLFAPAVRRVILDPIVEAVNLLRYTLTFVSQGLQWLVVLSVAFVVAGVYAARRLPEREKDQHPARRRPFPTEGPTIRVAHVLKLSSRFRHRRLRLVIELRDLAARVLAQHRGLPLPQAKTLLDTEDWTDDAAVRDYLRSDEHRHRLVGRRDAAVDVDRVLDQIERIHQEA